jgi:hypothetical protein
MSPVPRFTVFNTIALLRAKRERGIPDCDTRLRLWVKPVVGEQIGAGRLMAEQAKYADNLAAMKRGMVDDVQNKPAARPSYADYTEAARGGQQRLNTRRCVAQIDPP